MSKIKVSAELIRSWPQRKNLFFPCLLISGSYGQFLAFFSLQMALFQSLPPLSHGVLSVGLGLSSGRLPSACVFPPLTSSSYKDIILDLETTQIIQDNLLPSRSLITSSRTFFFSLLNKETFTVQGIKRLDIFWATTIQPIILSNHFHNFSVL